MPAVAPKSNNKKPNRFSVSKANSKVSYSSLTALPPLLAPRQDLKGGMNIETQAICRRAESIEAKEGWVRQNAPAPLTAEQQKHALFQLVAEANHFHQENRSTTLEDKSEALRQHRGTTDCTRLPSIAGGISQLTAKMLRDDVNVIFDTYEEPYAVGMKAMQGFGLWSLRK